jgi:hypothetical protein
MLLYFLIVSWVLLAYGKNIVKWMDLNIFMLHLLGYSIITGLWIVSGTNIFLSFLLAIPVYLWYVISTHANNKYWIMSLGSLSIVYILEYILGLVSKVFTILIRLLQVVFGLFGVGINIFGGVLTVLENRRFYWTWIQYVMFIFRIGTLLKYDDIINGLYTQTHDEIRRWTKLF